MLVALGVWKLVSIAQLHRCIKFLFVFLLAIHLLKTTWRNRDWYSNEILATSAIKLTKGNSKMFTMLAKAFTNRGDLETSELLNRLAIAVQPDDPMIKRRLVHTLQAQGRFEEAELVSDMSVNTASCSSPIG